MTENLPGRITDPKALRALSHPTRWKLIELLGLERTATATRCAEFTGESVASCSYHLNMLAKYGFVEQAEGGTGREKPWKLTTSSTCTCAGETWRPMRRPTA
jgi:predicted transcriptional regulator